MTYQITVSSKDGELLAQAYGDVETMAYHAKKVGFAKDVDYTASITEHDKIGSEATRSIVSITADGELVSLWVKRKLTGERKLLAVPAATDPATEGESTPDQTEEKQDSPAPAVPAVPTTRGRAAK
jgi:hypothetical protein